MASVLSELMFGPPTSRARGMQSVLSGFLGGLDDGYGAVSSERALQVTTAYACVRLLAGLGSSLPPKVLQRGDRSRKEVRRPEFQHLWGRPNPSMSRPAFWAAQILALQGYGNAYLWKGRLGATSPAAPWLGVQQLWPLPPDTVSGGRASDSSKVFVIDRQLDTPYSTDEIGHTSLMSLDGFYGLSPVKQNAHALGLAIATERSGQQLFSRGQQLSGILTTDQVLDPAQADEIRDRWVAQHAGPSNAQRPAVLGRGATYQAIAIPPEDAQFLQTRLFQREETLSIWGIPPHMLGYVSKSTSWGTGMEQQFIGFVVTVIVPMMVLFESMAAEELLPPELELRFSLQALMRGDMSARSNFYRTLRMMGAMSADTILELEDLPPRGIPDDFLTPTNMARLVVPPGSATPASSDDEVAYARAQQAARGGASFKSGVTGGGGPEFTMLAEARCPECHALLGRNVVGASLYCKRCKAEQQFGPYLTSAALMASTREDAEGALPRDGHDLVEVLAGVIAERMV